MNDFTEDSFKSSVEEEMPVRLLETIEGQSETGRVESW